MQKHAKKQHLFTRSRIAGKNCIYNSGPNMQTSTSLSFFTAIFIAFSGALAEAHPPPLTVNDILPACKNCIIYIDIKLWRPFVCVSVCLSVPPFFNTTTFGTHVCGYIWEWFEPKIYFPPNPGRILGGKHRSGKCHELPRKWIHFLTPIF